MVCCLEITICLLLIRFLPLSNRNEGKLVCATFMKWKGFIASSVITYFIMVIRIIFSIEVNTLNQLSKDIVQQDSGCSIG